MVRPPFDDETFRRPSVGDDFELVVAADGDDDVELVFNNENIY